MPLLIERSHDPSPSVLDCLPTSSSTTGIRDEPKSKRARVLPVSEPTTIESRVARNSYDTMEQFASAVKESLEAVIKSVTASGEITEDASAWSALVQDLGADRLVMTCTALKNLLHRLCTRESKRLEQDTALGHQGAKKEPWGRPEANGLELESDRDAVALNTASRSVLTLFGNAAGHKQLFSSLQRNATNDGKSSLGLFLDQPQEISESTLPIGISTTKVIQTTQPLPRKRPSTFQDIFAPPGSLPGVQPPKQSKAASSRNVITWGRNNPPELSQRRSGYANEKLTTGRWLGYAGMSSAAEPSSPQARRRQRDRALSMSLPEPSQPSSDAMMLAQKLAKEDALFRSAYSNFAPSYDNTAALVPVEMKNEIWWQRYGSECFAQAFDSYLNPLVTGGDTFEEHDELPVDEEENFKQAVEAFVPDSLDDLKRKNTSEADGDALLREVSEMIETLFSYQRVRMSALTAASRINLTYNTNAQDTASGPAVPSAAEVETYKLLKAQLSLIVSTLPPFVVSKLNGDQLDELNISLHLPMEAPDYRGVMEEDAASRLAKQQAFQAAVGQAQQIRPGLVSTPSSQVRNAHVASTRSLGPAAQQSMPRTGSTFARQSLSSWQTPNQNHTATIQRPAYANTHHSNQSRISMGTVTRPNYATQPSPRPYQPNGNYHTPTLGNFQQRAPQAFGNAYSSAGSPPNQTQRALPQSPQTQFQQPFAQQQLYQQGQQQQRPPSISQASQSLQSASPQTRPTSALGNGLSRPQTPATPSVGQQQPPTPRGQTPNRGSPIPHNGPPFTTPGQHLNGRGPSGTPQPVIQSPQTSITPQPVLSEAMQDLPVQTAEMG